MRPVLLACEDEERIVELLRTLCEPLGVDVLAARDGATALAQLAVRRPALMTLDLVLPNLDGFAVLERVRQRKDLDDMPIVVLSALSDLPNVKRAYALGAVDFIAKPFNVDLLDAKLKVFLRMKRLADAVHQREALITQVVDHLSSGLCVVDAAGLVVRVNQAGAAALGMRAEVLTGARLADAVPGAEAMMVVSGDHAQRRVTLQTARGPRELGFTTVSVEVAGGFGAVAVFRELSEVERGRREAEERERWTHIAAAARSLVHEVRNPLTAIGMAAQVVARDECDTAVRKRLGKAIESEALRIGALVAEYVDGHDPQPSAAGTDLGEILREVVEINLLHSAARNRVTVVCPAGLPHVGLDSARLKQVVLNLVLNAVEATDDGGAIELEALFEAAGVVLQVRDSGCGIAPDDLPRIFDESYSTRGSGMGLPIIRRILDAHGGSVRVESTVQRGSVFTVWLPVAADRPRDGVAVVR